MARVPAGATAFPQRQAHFTMNLHTRWADPDKDAACIAWTRDLFYAAGAHAARSIYVNFIPEEGEPDQVVAAYGDNLERLRRVKERCDHGNLLRINHNIGRRRRLTAPASPRRARGRRRTRRRR